MRSDTSSHVRRDRRHAERRTRRRPALIAGGLAFSVIAMAGMTVSAPAAPAQASERTAANFSLASFTVPVPAAPSVTAPGEDPTFIAAHDALTAADASMAAAAAVTADIAASGLDIGAPATSVDTAQLEAAATRLEGAEGVPAVLLPSITEDVATLVAAVDGEVAGLRAALDAAIARKAEEEAAAAAEQARREAEAAAAAAAAAAAEAEAEADADASGSEQTTSSSSSAPAPIASGGGSGDNSPAGAQATARGMIGNYGWGDDQFSCLVSLWNRESGWNYQAYNRSSGAFGIPQALPGNKMASAGADWQTNAATQISWGLGYISGRYGTPCGAWGHSESTGWY